MVQNDVLDTARDEGLVEGLKIGRAEGLAEGREQGRMEGLRSVARRLISLGMSDREIAEMTGLTEDEIRTLR